MSVELTARGYVGRCDDCGKSTRLAATNPKAATALLRQRGWRRSDHIKSVRTYLWNCGCERAA